METNSPRPAEVFAPFGAALDLTKLILFQPFDFGKWFVIGFAAFLSHLNGGGGGGSFNYNRLDRAKWSFRSMSRDAFGSYQHNNYAGWMLPLLGIGAVVILAIVVVFLWLGARGKFIFTDCVVRNRGAIVEPWNEFRREGNSYFLFSVVLMLAFMVIMGGASIPLWVPVVLHGDSPEGMGLFLGLGLVGLAVLFILIPVRLIAHFMVPIMYRRRCGALAGFQAALNLIVEHAGVVILYCLFIVVLWIAFVAIACLTNCLTCCITAIPYLGTVILLPAYVFFMSYLLLFVRQFGPDFDAWANVVTAPLPVAPPPQSEPPPPPPTAPPILPV